MPPQGNNGVRFENQGDEYGGPPARSQGFDLTGKLVQWGLVKSPQEAQYVLLAIAVLAFVIAGYFFIGQFSSSSAPPPPPPNLAPDAASR